MNDNEIEFKHKEEKKALLIALINGASISKSRSSNSQYIISLKKDKGIVPAGLIHELSQEGLLKKQDYPNQFFFTLSAKGIEKAKKN